MDCPAEFTHSFTDSLGPYAELDISSPSGSISISVHGLNLPYSEVVDYANNEGTAYLRGSLVTRGESLSVFQFRVAHSQTGAMEQHVYVVRDLGNLRTVIVEGKTSDTGPPATDELTRYCTRIASSMMASSSWMSDGKGGPGP